MSYDIVPYSIDTKEWGLHMLFNNIVVDLKCYWYNERLTYP